MPELYVSFKRSCSLLLVHALDMQMILDMPAVLMAAVMHFIESWQMYTSLNTVPIVIGGPRHETTASHPVKPLLKDSLENMLTTCTYVLKTQAENIKTILL